MTEHALLTGPWNVALDKVQVTSHLSRVGCAGHMASCVRTQGLFFYPTSPGAWKQDQPPNLQGPMQNKKSKSFAIK